MEQVAAGELKPEEAMKQYSFSPFEDLGMAKVDHHRSTRKGFPEVVFCEGKTEEQVVKIMQSLVEHHPVVLATRATVEQYEAVKKEIAAAEYNKLARTIVVRKAADEDQPAQNDHGRILILSAGTSDIPVAEEAAAVAEVMGNSVERVFDVGAAGIHRLLHFKEKISDANVIIVVAGMDGVLPTLVGGLVDKPVIAVPTSVGYGSAFEGLAPLLTMMNSCSPGVVVVNIDNGFGAGYFASMINRMK